MHPGNTSLLDFLDPQDGICFIASLAKRNYSLRHGGCLESCRCRCESRDAEQAGIRYHYQRYYQVYRWRYHMGRQNTAIRAFRTDVDSGVGYPLLIKGWYNAADAGKLSYALIHRGVADRIHGLDLGSDHCNPDGELVGKKHKNYWVPGSRQMGLRARRYYRAMVSSGSGMAPILR